MSSRETARSSYYPSVLLIDPFPDEAEMYATHLRGLGFKTTVSADSQEGLERAIRTLPDVVVTRLRQSGPLTGLEIVARLKTHAATRNVAVVMITSSIKPSDRVAARAAGCDAYMLLPVVPDALAAELRRVLRQRSRHDERRTFEN